jgi:hypothetical protein
MTEVLKSIIASILSTIEFTSFILLPDKVRIRWLPILQYGKTEYYMGLLEDGDWAVEAKEGLYRLDEQSRYVSVMALLEQPINTVHEHLTEFFNSIAIKVNLYELFPFESIVRAGFEQGSEYWAELAFDWYQELPEKTKYSLIDSISKIIDAKWASQKLRQNAKKEMRKMDQR